MSSSSIHLVANGTVSFFVFLRLNNIPLYVYTSFLYSSADGHLCFFHGLAVGNNASLNMGVQASLFEIDTYRNSYTCRF